MNIHEVIKKRKSTRAYLKRSVSRAIITKILDSARYAPSGANTQPWQVTVVTGKKKKEIEQALLKAYKDKVKSQKDFQYYPLQWDSPYRERRIATGVQLYKALHIERHDMERRREQWMANYRAFDAPVALYFFMDSSLAVGSYMDYGMFLQSLMLAAVEEGLATCPQAALAEFPDIVKNCLGYSERLILLCGMALGYENKEAPVNSYRTAREEVSGFTRFFD